MVLFPYNSMFSIDFTKDYQTDTYQLKINDKPVQYTQQWWWKKDFMETSLRNYALQLHDVPYIEKYILYAYAHTSYRELLLKQLKPSLTDHHWLIWYAGFGKMPVKDNAIVSIWKYHLVFNEQTIIIDSIEVFNQKLQP